MSEEIFDLTPDEHLNINGVMAIPFPSSPIKTAEVMPPLPSWIKEIYPYHWEVDIQAYLDTGQDLPVELGRFPQFAGFWATPHATMPPGSTIQFKSTQNQVADEAQDLALISDYDPDEGMRTFIIDTGKFNGSDLPGHETAMP